MTVTYGDSSIEVDLGELTALDLDDGEGEVHVRLASVIEAADLGVALNTLEVGFVATDGFRPSASTSCDGLTPVSSETLARGCILPVSRNLAWDDALDFPGCMGVGDVVAIESFDAD